LKVQSIVSRGKILESTSALNALLNLTKVHPDHSAPLEGLGLLFYHKNQLEVAIKWFIEALMKTPPTNTAEYYLLDCLSKLGLKAEFYQLANTINRDKSNPYSGRIHKLIEKNKSTN